MQNHDSFPLGLCSCTGVINAWDWPRSLSSAGVAPSASQRRGVPAAPPFPSLCPAAGLRLAPTRISPSQLSRRLARAREASLLSIAVRRAAETVGGRVANAAPSRWVAEWCTIARHAVPECRHPAGAAQVTLRSQGGARASGFWTAGGCRYHLAVALRLSTHSLRESAWLVGSATGRGCCAAVSGMASVRNAAVAPGMCNEHSRSRRLQAENREDEHQPTRLKPRKASRRKNRCCMPPRLCISDRLSL